MNQTIFNKKRCPFYWDKNTGMTGKIMNEKTRKCILYQAKDNEQGEPGCVYHGSMSPVCSCQSKYLSVDMVKIGKMKWECPKCQKQMTGKKSDNGYNVYDYGGSK
ncbi:hypothetical protein [endosymbiont GvMRE of Glomus versiforme]|uniref:hypothetical protein n=1 Tax=endosymbiont GvMRE of Glomus versiforme TaxID=2039283 RepID=UPI000ECA585C|nr:hypothetical protein [endosymbiont GvMRE of Glomus versiforme]RHZ36815.1 hypothetical protein GvMRE_I2g46 [endosymbiont GvMRE of Glomus versiforme]